MASTNSGILVVIDTSEHDNEFVIQRALEMAKNLDTDIELFACTYNPNFYGKRTDETPELRSIKAHYVIDKKRTLDELVAKVAKNGPDIKTDVSWDLPEYEAIVRKIYRSKPALVVRRSDYRSAVDRALMSDDDWALVKHCPAPLYLVRGEKKVEKTGVVWAAVDPMHEHDKPASLDDKIIKEAKLLAHANNATVHLYHVFDSVAAIAALAAGIAVIDTLPSQEIQNQTRDLHFKRLKELATKHQIPMDRVHNYPGAVRTLLPALAIERRPDVIVMGVVARGFFKRTIIGSTARKILDKLPGDLCMVKPPEFASRIDPDSTYELRYSDARELAQGAT